MGLAYLILGLFGLAIGLMVMRSFAQANPTAVARRTRTGAGIAALGVAALLFLRGGGAIAVPLAMLGSWLIWGRATPPWLGGGGNARRTPGQSSAIVTEHLEMELDHDTGEMHGRVLKGMFAGRSLSALSPTDLALLWQDCRHTDAQSAQLLEAYLDRLHPTWREDMARGESAMSGGPGGRMTREEALEILGLAPGADSAAIRRAHRELMLKMHPDRGGSTYLAAKINEAKDVALEALNR